MSVSESCGSVHTKQSKVIKALLRKIGFRVSENEEKHLQVKNRQEMTFYLVLIFSLLHRKLECIDTCAIYIALYS